MERWVGKIAVVTGASSGIGLATAKALVRNGMTVVGLSRRPDKMVNEMATTKGTGKFFASECDVAKESDVIRSFAWIEQNFETVHVLVNNAGVIKLMCIEDMKTEDIQNIFDVNVMGLLYCTRQALSLMKKNGHEAHIVNINGASGHKILNTRAPLNIYPATKHAVTAICDSLINELRGEENKIRVTSISPGFVKTNMFNIVGVNYSILSKSPVLNPEDVADSIIYVISAPPHVQITELTIKPLNSYV